MDTFVTSRLAASLLIVMLAARTPDARAQTAAAGDAGVAASARLIVAPHCRTSWRGSADVRVTGVRADVRIVNRVATTTLDITIQNAAPRALEAEVVAPLPDGATVRGFAFEGEAREAAATVLPRAEATREYERIVAQLRDPALLEFAGRALVKSSVFPLAAGATQTVRLTYEHIVAVDGDRIDYELPRTESVLYDVPWEVTVRLEMPRPIVGVYSPSHEIDVRRETPTVSEIRIPKAAQRQPGALRLSCLLEKRDAVTASLFAYPGATPGEGYFLLLAGLPAAGEDKDAKSIHRDVTLVIDRSGSMAGEKIEQAKAAARQVLAGLSDGEHFRLISYNDAVQPFSAESVVVNAESRAAATKFIDALTAVSGTNIHDALIEALQSPPAAGTLPILLFLTDGLATVGETSELAIRKAAEKSNVHKRRIFSFGVGFDVNTPLLQKLAFTTRGTPTFVLPAEDVEVKVGQVFRKLAGPVLASPNLSVPADAGQSAPARVSERMPDELPDVFDGEQIVVLGRYHGTEPLRFRLTGNYRGRERVFDFELGLDKASTQHGFVPRLWATRKIGTLVDAVQQLGAEMGTVGPVDPGSPPAGMDPRMKELTDEIVRLSREFGILTEYTAFLATEGVDLSDAGAQVKAASLNLQSRAVQTRSGQGAVNQSLNATAQVSAGCANPTNAYWNAEMQRVAVTTVQQVCDRTYYKRGNGWVDARVVDREKSPPDQMIEFGSPEYRALLERLAEQQLGGILSVPGEILLEVDGKVIRITGLDEGC